jgi:hypothetical protein
MNDERSTEKPDRKEQHTTCLLRHSLGSDTELSECAAVPLLRTDVRDVAVNIGVRIDNGAGGEPTDAPVGSWELWLSHDGNVYARTDMSVLDAALLEVTPNGSGVDGTLNLRNVPGAWLKVRYRHKSGGDGDSRMDVVVTTFDPAPSGELRAPSAELS